MIYETFDIIQQYLISQMNPFMAGETLKFNMI